MKAHRNTKVKIFAAFFFKSEMDLTCPPSHSPFSCHVMSCHVTSPPPRRNKKHQESRVGGAFAFHLVMGWGFAGIDDTDCTRWRIVILPRSIGEAPSWGNSKVPQGLYWLL